MLGAVSALRRHPRTLIRCGMLENDFGRFPTTSWSLIARASGADQEALAALLELYIPALEAHLTRRVAPQDARDILQSFVTEKVLDKPLVTSARQDRGKFRAYVLAALNNFCTDWWRRRRKQVDAEAASLDENSEVASRDESCSGIVETAWATQVVRESLRRMESYCKRTGQQVCWEIFDCRLLGPALREEGLEQYSSVVKRLGLSSPREAANRLTTAKRIFTRHLRGVIHGYVQGATDEVDEELRDLKVILENTEDWPSPTDRAKGT